jgi:hypothetical protein
MNHAVAPDPSTGTDSLPINPLEFLAVIVNMWLIVDLLGVPLCELIGECFQLVGALVQTTL